MYLMNPEVIPKEKIFYCNGILANYLIYTCNFPLFAKKGREYGFARTEALEEILEKLPFWLRVTRCF